MTNTAIAPVPLWLLFSVPAAVIVSSTCLVAFGSNPTVTLIAGIVSLGAVLAAFVVAPVAIYALVANRELRSLPQFIGVAFCALPILGMIASYLFGGI